MIDIEDEGGYYIGMKSNTNPSTKSSITLPPKELALVLELQTQLNAKTKVEVVRRGLKLLKEVTDRESLRRSYSQASTAVRVSTEQEIAELDSLVNEGLPDS